MVLVTCLEVELELQILKEGETKLQPWTLLQWKTFHEQMIYLRPGRHFHRFSKDLYAHVIQNQYHINHTW